MEEKIKDLKENIVSYIQSNKVKMRPRWHFVLITALRVLVVGVVFISFLYIASFITLIMREKALFKILGIGPHDIHGFMLGVPWLLVLLSLSLIVILEVMTRKFSFVYKRPIAYSLFTLLVIALGAGIVIHKVDKDFRFARFGERPDMPILGPVHRYYRGDFKDRPFIKDMQNKPPLPYMGEMKYLPD